MKNLNNRNNNNTSSKDELKAGTSTEDLWIEETSIKEEEEIVIDMNKKTSNILIISFFL